MKPPFPTALVLFFIGWVASLVWMVWTGSYGWGAADGAYSVLQVLR